MTLIRRAAIAWVALALLVDAGARPAARAASLPGAIPDAEFWTLLHTLSEPDGYFRSDNLVSNEMVFARLVPELTSRVPQGGVYLGVGPEQNFTYIAAIRPRVAFILDIRRGNLLLQLMYKSLFELSDNRADFMARLLNRARPDGLSDASTARQIMDAYWTAPAGSEESYRRNLTAIEERLQSTHGFALSEDDRDGLETVYHAFYWFGPGLTWSSTSGGMTGRTTLADLLSQSAADGQELSFLASEARFTYVKDLESRNLIVPVVGDFAGPSALRAIGAWLRERGGVVSAFYLSNVEQYLQQDHVWGAFCSNAATLPIDDASVFIRPSGAGVRVLPPSTLPSTRVLLGGGTTPIQVAPPPSPAAPPSMTAPLTAPFGSMRADTTACLASR